MTRLVIVRHGQAVCNVERTIEGVATCRGLTQLGHQQSIALGRRLADEGFTPDVMVASPIRRARETAEHLASALGGEFLTDPDLEEVRPGEAEGMTWDQYSAFFGTTEGWDPSVPFAPGAEAWRDFARRAAGAIDRVSPPNEDRTVLVVAHGGVIDASVFYFFGLDPSVQSPIDFETTNTSITEWQRRTFTPPATSPVHRWRLARYNDAAHLPFVVAAPTAVTRPNPMAAGRAESADGAREFDDTYGASRSMIQPEPAATPSAPPSRR